MDIDVEKSGSFKNLIQVYQYLAGQGYKLARSTLYNHAKRGLLLADPDGSYSTATITKYARLHLQFESTRQTESERDVLERMSRAKALLYQERAAAAQLDRLSKEGRLVSRDQMDLELAARAATLEAGLNYWIQTNAATWVSMVGGRTEMVRELVLTMISDLEAMLDNYSRPIEFAVSFTGGENGIVERG